MGSTLMVYHWPGIRAAVTSEEGKVEVMDGSSGIIPKPEIFSIVLFNSINCFLKGDTNFKFATFKEFFFNIL